MGNSEVLLITKVREGLLITNKIELNKFQVIGIPPPGPQGFARALCFKVRHTISLPSYTREKFERISEADIVFVTCLLFFL